MSESSRNTSSAPAIDVQELVAQSDTGARNPKGIPGKILWIVPFLWACFQLWYASPLPFVFDILVLNDTQARAIHLAFALFLTYTAYPAFKKSPRDHIPVIDWVLALAGAFAASYLYLFYDELAGRSGSFTDFDIAVGAAGMLLLLEATRRALGPPLMVVAALFLFYTFGGQMMPDVIAHKGASLTKTIGHQWLTTEGVFGVALGVSTSFVFLFVLFGALLDKAGAGNWFIQVAFSLLGHMRGGPAKASVVASGLSGLVSGSSIANVVTTGTFTIPLMKRVGFPGYKAGAVEVAASTNGQLTPPIMGAAAFLMVEYVGVSYVEVIQHAILPALISYIALFYIVHLEAVKAGMQGLPRRTERTLAQSLMAFVGSFLLLAVIAAIVYYGIGWTKDVFGDAATWIIAALTIVAYIALVRVAAKTPPLKIEDAEAELTEMPEAGPTILAGLHYLLPIVALVWCLVVERFSPGLSAFWATVFLIFVVLTQRPLLAYFRGETRSLSETLKEGFNDFTEGMVSGSRNMIGIGVATAAAGIVVGTVTLTGIGLVMTEFVEFISGGSLILMLLFTAGISLILGMGLPTTANYIVVSTLMAPVIVTLGAQHGLIVPLIAVHLFVFYFGILADDTPPVGLAAFAAAGLAGSDPIRTGIQGFMYDIRTAILPFMFIFNTELLLIGIESIPHLILTILSATLAMLVFAAATQGFWMTRNRLWETAALLLVAFTLFRPGFWWDEIYPPIKQMPSTEIYKVAEALPDNATLRMRVKGETLDGDMVEKIVALPLGPKVDGQSRLEAIGLTLREENGIMVVDMVGFDSPAQKAGIDFDWQILDVEQELDRPDKQWMFVPALLLLLVVFMSQKARVRREEGLAHA
ncbi:TRAP transporter permease [Hahella sp. SMD15-11]|uniref:TRAP transporter permease n=1 Tax=Thermohahella caldifontis TaxID=3142973 RepID=A0AB39UTX1_9GAMM